MMMYGTTDDVWDYIHSRGLDYCRAYDRLAEIGVGRHHQRVGPLPLSQGEHLWLGWPEMYVQLIRRYGLRWTRPVSNRRPPGMDPLLWLDIQELFRDHAVV